MEDERRPLLLLRFNLAICAIVAVTFLSLTILLFAVPSIFGNNYILFGSLFIALLIISSTIFGGVLRYYLGRISFFNSLRDENKYTLGVRSTFYNLEAFKDKVRLLTHKRNNKNKLQFVLAFSPTSTMVVGGANRNQILQLLNQRIAEFINRLMLNKEVTDFSRKNCVYCFDRNVFLFYLFVNNENDVHTLIHKLSSECFRLVEEEKQIRIWVQPFSGICKAENNEESLTAVIEKALIAKSQSEQNIESFSYFKEGHMVKDTTIAEDIQKGLNNKEFVPYYQAKYSLTKKEFVSAEALARWNSPEGILSPIKFIDRAGRAGLLNEIDLEIFEASVRDLGEQLRRGRRVVPISVNFSLYEFFSRNFYKRIHDTLQANQVPPTLLEIEITETTSQVNKFLSVQVIKKLQNDGIRILMDDFGTGFSQIENLREIPFDAIKIDKSFTDRIVEDEKIRSIVRFLIQLIHDNQMEAIVEGVESQEQVDILRKMKVDTIQGFYYSKPLPSKDFQLLLKDNPFEKKGAKK